MDIRVIKTPDFKKLLKTLRTTDDEILSFATSLIVGIQKRTQKGKDANNKTFDPQYSEKYKEFRKRSKRSTKVNLTFHGHMLNGMRVKKYRDGAMIFFDRSENDKAYYNHVSMGREFFSLDDDQEDLMMKRIGKFIAKGLK